MGGITVEHVPTEKTRETVKTLAGYKLPQIDIALVVGVSPPTLLKYYRLELDVGAATGNAILAQSLHTQAVGRPAEYDANGNLIREELKPDKSAAIFSAKVRLGMKETQRIEHTGANGGPVATAEIDLTVLNDTELELFWQLYNKAKRRQEAEPDPEGEMGDGGAASPTT